MSTPPPITLHPLSTTDSPTLQAVYEAASDYFELIAGFGPAPGQAETDLADAGEGRHLLGIFLRDSPVGVVDLRLADPGPYDVRLGLILLTPEQRGRGIGGWALRIIEEWLRQATPTEAIMLTVPAQDHAAQTFFARHGYAFTGQAVRTLIGEKRTRLLFMRKEIG